MPVLVPPLGWIADPDDDNGGVVCGDCGEPEEVVAWMNDLALVERAMEGDHKEDA